jgi:hypothetical protein
MKMSYFCVIFVTALKTKWTRIRVNEIYVVVARLSVHKMSQVWLRYDERSANGV